LYREILLPENTIARGIGPQSRQLDGPTVLAITVSQSDAPLSRMLLLYSESGDTPITVIPYDISSDVGETRIVIDELGGSEFRQFDVVVKELREKTGAGILDCQKALTENGNSIDKAIDYLRQKGLAAAQKKAGRETNQGLIHAYIHAGGKIGVLIEVNCETDFVARNEQFKAFVNDLALQVAAASPSYVRREEIAADVVAKERSIYEGQAKELGKPPAAWPKIVEGKLEKFYQENCLLEQGFIKDPSVVIKDLLAQQIATIGENMNIRRFTRFQLGQA
jgi:elongation factor Ts